MIRDYYSGGLIGCDKEGGTVKIELLGRLDLKGLMRSCTKFDMERHKFCEYESMCMDMIARSQAVSIQREVNSSRVEFNLKNIKMNLQFVSFIETEMPQRQLK